MDKPEETGITNESADTRSGSKHPGSKFGLILGLIVLFIPLFFYIIFLCPTVFVGDAGDFLTASFTLGIPHPPGYPVYTLLGNFFMNLPIPGGLSSPAFRMNMLSAVAGWGACVFLFLFLRRVIKTEWAALVGALALAFSRQFWQHAEIAEVYTLQILFVTLIFYLAVLYVQEKKLVWAYLMAFFMGLALSHQYAVLLFYPGVLIFVYLNGGFKVKWTVILLAFLLAVSGLIPYVYLPIVKYKTPVGEVVFVADAQEGALVPMEKVASTDNPWIYFWDYFSRRGYSKSRVYTHNVDVMPERTTTPMVFRKFIQTTVEDFQIPLMVVSGFAWIAGLLSIFRRRKKSDEDDDDPFGIPRAAMLPPALGYIIYFLIVHFYPSGDILSAPMENLDVVVPPLLIPLMVGLAAMIAFGFDIIQRGIAGYVRSQGISEVESSQKYRVFTALLVIAAFMLIGINIKESSAFCDKSHSIISYNYAKNVLDSTDENAILLTTGDETFLFWYVQACEPSNDPDDPLPGYRKDVWATNWIHNLPGLAILSEGESLAMALIQQRFIQSSTYYSDYLDQVHVEMILPTYGARPVNTTYVTDTFAESDLIGCLDVVLNGLTYTFRTPGDIPDIGLPEVTARPDLGAIIEGAAPMSVIDYFDSRPLADYTWAGLPRFEGVESDFSNLANAEYISVHLEAQEMEVLGRYQDALYRFGIQSLLHDTQESREMAVEYLFRCVSLNPTGWFGWKELGDAFFSTSLLDSAGDAYEMLISLSNVHGDIDPGLLAGAHAQIGHIALIRSSSHQLTDDEQFAMKQLAQSESQLALMLNPNDSVAKAVLGELERQARNEAETNEVDDDDKVDDEIVESESEEPSVPEDDVPVGGLDEFDT